MYSRLTEVLTELGETDLQVHRAFVVQLGCVALLTSEEPTLTYSDFASKDRFPNFCTELIEALKKHPNIFDVAMLDEKEAVWSRSLGGGTLVFQDSPFSLRVDIPARLQQHCYPFEEKPIERFEAICSGSLFAAFAAIQDYPAWPHIGHEYREILRTQIEEETDFKPHAIGPSPIHPVFYFVLRKKPIEVPPADIRVYAVNNDILVVFDDNSRTNHDIVVDFLDDVHRPLDYFYSAMLIHVALIHSWDEILDNFSKLSDSIKTLFATPWWRIFKSSKFARLGRESLSSIHTSFVDLETVLFYYDVERNRVLNEISQHRVLSYLHSYFHSRTEPDIQVPKALPSALQYFAEELQTFGNIRSVVIASLVGAAIGAILTVLLTQVF